MSGRWAWAALAWIIAGCSSSEETIKDQLVGTWGIESSPTSGFTNVFNDDGTFEMDVVGFRKALRQEL